MQRKLLFNFSFFDFSNIISIIFCLLDIFNKDESKYKTHLFAMKNIL